MAKLNQVVHVNGTVFWYEEGLLHRLNGPAKIIPAFNVEYWYFKGKLHRTDGPAIEQQPGYKKQGYKAWYIEGMLHRLDGPAVEWSNGDKEWWVKGDQIYDLTLIKNYEQYDELAEELMTWYSDLPWFGALELCWDYINRKFVFKISVKVSGEEAYYPKTSFQYRSVDLVFIKNNEIS